MQHFLRGPDQVERARVFVAGQEELYGWLRLMNRDDHAQTFEQIDGVEMGASEVYDLEKTSAFHLPRLEPLNNDSESANVFV